MLARGTPWFITIPPVVLVLLAAVLLAGTVPVTWWSVPLVVLAALFTFLTVFFFRDPRRPLGEGVVAPAHGRVLDVTREEGMVRVSTFMGPMDVHVVRAPLDGRVVSMRRSGRGYHRAYTPDAGHNVQLRMDLEGDREPFTVVMVSGWFARRIVPYVEVGDRVARGSRIGLIRFGSRVDVLVPEGSHRITARSGERVRAGSSSLGVRMDEDS